MQVFHVVSSTRTGRLIASTIIDKDISAVKMYLKKTKQKLISAKRLK